MLGCWLNLRRKGWGRSPVRASAGARWWCGQHRMCGRLAIASFYPSEGFSLLEGVKFLRPSELHSIVGCALAAFSHSGLDQLTLELSHRGHDVEHETPTGAGCVDVLLAQADKADVVLAEAFEDVEQV